MSLWLVAPLARGPLALRVLGSRSILTVEPLARARRARALHVPSRPASTWLALPLQRLAGLVIDLMAQAVRTRALLVRVARAPVSRTPVG